MKIISGGQTGADKGGLLGARDLGIETGGFAPKGFRTELGNDPSLADFGLIETESYQYPIRTRKNVEISDMTLWFGRTGSPGYICTVNACFLKGRGFYIIDPRIQSDIYSAAGFVARYRPRAQIFNIAGNRESTNPGIEQAVREAVRQIFLGM